MGSTGYHCCDHGLSCSSRRQRRTRDVGWHAVSDSHGTQRVTPLDHEGLYGLGALSASYSSRVSSRNDFGLKRRLSTGAHAIDATEAQRATDTEIATHEATIRDLRYRRNAHSNISKLPSEIFATIFLLVNVGTADRGANHSEKWINVAGVCRRWREVALVSPRLWCTIDICQPTCALTLLARSKSAPLQIRGSASETEELMSTKTDEEVAKAVMEKIGCIQSLDLQGWQGENILRFLHLNAPAPAPMLEHLRLVAKGRVVPPVSLPPDISQRVMPSLRHLELKSINISSDFPPLPHLRRLKLTSIQSPAIRPSTLLSLLQYSPELETIEVEGVDEEDLSDCPRARVQLWNLFNLSITSKKIAASVILGHLDFPPSADVTFLSEREHAGNPDLSNLVEICANRFAAHGAHSIDEVQIHGGQRFQLSGWRGRHRCLYISFSLERQNIPTGFLTFCLALRLETVSTLELDCLVEMPQTQWTELFSAFKQVENLRFTGFRIIRPLRALIKVPGNSPLLPRLKALQISDCFICQQPSISHRASLASKAFTGLRKLLKERKHLEIPVKVLFEFCSITAAAIGRLSEFSEIDWDNSDIYMSDAYETEEEG